jgi:[protein-PII] uridylyltransferase
MDQKLVPEPAIRPVQAEPIAQWRNDLAANARSSVTRFFASPDTARLLRDHASLVDHVIREVFTECAMPRDVAAVAVGGYGRGQLYPHSDVDVLVLLPRA